MIMLAAFKSDDAMPPRNRVIPMTRSAAGSRPIVKGFCDSGNSEPASAPESIRIRGFIVAPRVNPSAALLKIGFLESIDEPSVCDLLPSLGAGPFREDGVRGTLA